MSDLKSDLQVTHGLACPNCGGMINIPEGQVIVRCPFCDLRSFVKGERGLLRYQVPQKISREQAEQSFRGFLKRSMAIALDAKSKATLSESFLVYLPFWTAWTGAIGWAFGQKKIRSGDSTRYEPREVKLFEEITWNRAACDVGEFGVTQVTLGDQPNDPFQPAALHSAGMVFEPVGVEKEARDGSRRSIEESMRRKANLDNLSQMFLRQFRQRFGLVYYPLWVLRYLYRGRVFQVVVDGFNGKVLYGKAPGNTLYRAAALVLGMAFGAFVGIDLGTLLLTSNSDDSATGGLVVFVIGLGIMFAAYRAFRYGEQYEYRAIKDKSLDEITRSLSITGNVKDLEKWINRLS